MRKIKKKSKNAKKEAEKYPEEHWSGQLSLAESVAEECRVVSSFRPVYA